AALSFSISFCGICKLFIFLLSQSIIAYNYIIISVDNDLGLLYARALKGQRAQGPRPTKRGKNVSIIGAMSVNEILTSVNLIGGTDAITFEAFIIRKLVPKLWKGACVVMDNCSIHMGEEVKKAIEKKGAKLIYLSPYSPDFSPIENLWSKLKIILRSIKTTNYQELAKAIDLAFSQVTSSNIFNWFTHCCYCTSSL
ncbi:transposase, partial [Lyngbya sp. CCAP 1446/10]|uniref:transposase n=1 Tax=Lyngbya sp. CCAP 1446/10 TaxID=439293 RepID=UPI002238DE9C